jgi:hypothetical protein
MFVANDTRVAYVVKETMQSVWPDIVKFDLVLLVVTDFT